MATVSFLYRSIKPNMPLNVRLYFRHGEVDYTLGAKTELYIYGREELANDKKLSARDYWPKLHERRTRDIILKNKQIEIDARLNELTNYILKEFDQADARDVINNKNWLKEVLDLHYNPPVAAPEIPLKLVAFIDYYIEHRKNELTVSRVKSINATKHKLQRFEAALKRGFLISEVNEEFKSLFVDYSTGLKYAKNTQQRELKLIKTVCRFASQRMDLKVSSQMEGLRLPKERVKHIYLNEDELQAIAQLDIKKKYIDNARDWLLISCYTGQRISDFLRFNSSMIRVKDGKRFLEFTQVKTKKNMLLPLSGEVLKILASHGNEFPRKLSHTKCNDYIKEVCRLAGINEMCEGKKRVSIAPEGVKPGRDDYRDVIGEFEKWELVSSHIGRRSFATNGYGKVPTSILAYMTGHSTEAMLLEYIGKSPIDAAMDAHKYFN